MKLKVNKRWYQFWLPSELEIKNMAHLTSESEPVPTVKLDKDGYGWGQTSKLDDQPAAIEADEAEPWYGGDVEEADDGGVVTAEPPVVYANRGNARMAERAEANKP